MRILGIRIVFNPVCALVLFPVQRLDPFPGRRHIDIGKPGAVGTHIRDQAFLAIADIDAFIEFLGDRHGPLGRKAQLGRGFLLQRGGNERLERRRRLGGRLDTGQGKFTLAVIVSLHGIRFIVQFRFLPVDAGQGSRERNAVLAELRVQRPVFLRDKGLNFLFPFHDQFQGY